MNSASDVAAGFSISGLLDAGAKTRSKYPVAELDIDAIEDNTENGDALRRAFRTMVQRARDT